MSSSARRSPAPPRSRSGSRTAAPAAQHRPASAAAAAPARRRRPDAAATPRRASAGRPGDRLLAGAPAWLPAAAVLGGPMLAAVLGKFAGGYHGPVFELLTVLTAALATAAATAAGRWWVVTALPPVAWLVAVVAELAWHDPAYVGTKRMIVGLVEATTNVFPVILAALAAMGLVIALAVVRGRRQYTGGTRRV